VDSSRVLYTAWSGAGGRLGIKGGAGGMEGGVDSMVPLLRVCAIGRCGVVDGRYERRWRDCCNTVFACQIESAQKIKKSLRSFSH
jgi:hypothetical protein